MEFVYLLHILLFWWSRFLPLICWKINSLPYTSALQCMCMAVVGLSAFKPLSGKELLWIFQCFLWSSLGKETAILELVTWIKAQYRWAKHRPVQQKPANIRPVCTPTCLSEAGQTANFCPMGMLENQLQVSIGLVLPVLTSVFRGCWGQPPCQNTIA